MCCVCHGVGGSEKARASWVRGLERDFTCGHLVMGPPIFSLWAFWRPPPLFVLELGDGDGDPAARSRAARCTLRSFARHCGSGGGESAARLPTDATVFETNRCAVAARDEGCRNADYYR